MNTDVWTSHAAIPQIVTDDEPGTFEATASAFDSIANGEKGPTRFASAAFDKTVQAKATVPLLWSHDDSKPIGLADLRVVPGQGLVAKARLALGTKQADEAYALLKIGAINSVSIGFNPKKAHVAEGGGVRIVDEADVMEVSLVTFPADPAAKVKWMHRSWIEWYADPKVRAKREYETIKAAQAEAQARRQGW